MRSTLILVLSALVLLPTAGCDRDSSGPPEEIQPTTNLDTLWPNEDGRHWVYRLTQRQWAVEESLFPDPFVLTVDDIDSVLAVTPDPDAIETRGAWMLKFDGMLTTQSDVTAQALVETLFGDVGYTKQLPVSETTAERRARRLWPWTADSAYKALPAPLQPPFMLYGYAWEKTAEWIGQYGDVDTDLAWKYLEADVSVGHAFRFQLVPSLSDQVYLDSKIARKRTADTPLGHFKAVREVHYLLDRGVVTLTDESGNETYSGPSYMVCTIFFATAVGPIYAIERDFLPGFILDPPTTLVLEHEMEIIGTGLDARATN